MNTKNPLSHTEWRGVLSLATIFSCRMLGLFIILPVFALYGMQLRGATPALVGLAMGSYGLSQAIMQMPLGFLSDKTGRKPVLLGGLIIFIAGSVLAALSHTIMGVIIGRVLQGAGAVGSVTLALVADLTEERHRTKAMALIGMSIGFSFLLAMILGPLLAGWFQLPGLFWFTAFFGLICIGVLLIAVPNPPLTLHPESEPTQGLFKRVLMDGGLLRLDFGILALHAILTGNFVAIPFLLHQNADVAMHQLGYVYVPMLLFALIIVFPLITYIEKRHQTRAGFRIGVTALLVAQLGLAFWHSARVEILVWLTLFFTAFTLLEAMLPSLVSKMASPRSKGTAMGVYSSAQFFGIFLGGSIAGIIFTHFQAAGVFLLGAAWASVWLGLAL